MRKARCLSRFVVERIKVGDEDGAEGVLERPVLPCVRPE